MDVQTAAKIYNIQVKCSECLTIRSRTHIVVANMCGVADLNFQEDSSNANIIVVDKAPSFFQ